MADINKFITEDILQPTNEKLDELWDLNEDISYTHRTNSKTGDKIIPRNARSFELKELGGVTRKGYQLADYTGRSSIISRGTTLEYSDGVFTSSGISTEQGYGGTITLDKPFTFKANQQYTMSISKSHNYEFILLTDWTAVVRILRGATSATFSVDVDTIINRITIFHYASIDCNDTFQLMINEGDVAHPYEPYTTDILTSNISDMVVSGKCNNLLRFDNLTTQTINGLTFTPTTDNGKLLYFTINGTSTARVEIYAINNVSYDIGSLSLFNNTPYTLILFNGSYTVINPNTALTLTNSKFTRIYYRIAESGVTFDNVKFYPMLNEGTTPLPYEPYTPPKTFPINLQLNGIGNVYDSLADGKVTRRIGVVDLGALNWDYASQWGASKCFVTNLADAYYGEIVGHGICQNYNEVLTGAIYNYGTDKSVCFNSSDNVVRLRITDSMYTNASDFKLAMSGVMLYYELATPIEEETTIKIADQCEAGGYISYNYEDKDKYALDIPNSIEYMTKTVPVEQKVQVITEDMCDVVLDATKGVAPYNTSYGMTYITVRDDSGVELIENGLYNFVINTKLVVASANRNVAIRIGENDSWHPLVNDTTSVLSGSACFVKSQCRMYQFKRTYFDYGAFHMATDSNTTYAYLVTYFYGDTTGSAIYVHNYSPRYALMFPVTPISEMVNLDGERWSSLVSVQSTGTTKPVYSNTFYLDRGYIYNNSAAVNQNAKPVNSVYQSYAGMDLRYTLNTSNTYCTARSRVFMYLHEFDESTLTFKADATVGNIVTSNRLATRFPNTVSGDVYLLLLGNTGSNWHTLYPELDRPIDCIYKYTPSTNTLVRLGSFAEEVAY